MSNLTCQNGATTTAPETARSVAVTPRVDVLETENEFLVVADMPGVKSEDVDIRFEKGELTVHGKRACGCNSESTFREYGATDYHRVFGVADSIAADRISAELKNGVLTVQLPKVEAVKPKKISVKG
jgi:HSP20 family protein